MAIYLMVESHKGSSANQLHRVLGVNYRTAWYLCHRIHEAMDDDPLTGPALLGVVEVDETFVGGKVKGKGRGYKDNKVIVAGALLRDGQLRVERIPDTTKPTLQDFIGRAIKDKDEAIYTDEFKSYIGIEDHDTRHETVNHSEEVWVIEDMHTNGIEGVWSLFKRSIVGAFQKIRRSTWTATSKNLSGASTTARTPTSSATPSSASCEREPDVQEFGGLIASSRCVSGQVDCLARPDYSFAHTPR